MNETNKLEELQQDVINFISSPGDYLFESVYQRIYQICQSSGKQEIKNVVSIIIQQICESATTLPPQENESNIDLLNRRLDRFKQDIILIANIFSYYDSHAEKGEKVHEIAVQTILSKYFLLETTVTVLQKDISDIFNPVLRNQVAVPESVKSISSFVHIMNEDLYKRIFDNTLTNEVNFYFQTLNLEEMPIFDRINSLYEIYTRVNEVLSESLQSNTVTLFKELFCNGVMQKDIDVLVSQASIMKIEDPELLGKLYFLVKLGPSQWENNFVTFLTGSVRSRLEDIFNINNSSNSSNPATLQPNNSNLVTVNGNNVSIGSSYAENFYEYTQKVSEIYSELMNTIQNYLGNSELVTRFVYNTFSRFLGDQNFPHELCIFLDKTLEPAPFLTVLGRFLKSDTSFEENYGIFLAHRLLSNPNPEAEEVLLKVMTEAGVVLEKPMSMLSDFNTAPKLTENVLNTEVSLVMLNRFYWSSLHIPEFTPPKIFTDMFDHAVAAMKYDTFRKNVRMSDRYSTVEFSDGTTTFSLPFTHACIVQTVLSDGPINKFELCNRLIIRYIDALPAIKFLIQAKILHVEDDILSFLGPPATTFNESGETIEPERAPEDPVLYTNCSDQINAAILRFLKQKRFAGIEEIKEAVYNTVPNKFPVTDEKISACLKKMLEKELIMHHGGNTNSYRYCRH
ncbi:hypothetical protein TRFO_10292 [Tritrichomonas foetus]|uniref:Cullin N-terminal domain-containing protein n=1 Tax=Tritrichomonas foetus TaxID=1144522 RepID=A0A1J4JB36_9EUKA|nr:hypothetical protein TRFO_10292 [Tritrichomonas foetus]|eukprot:OHS95881.1 hypothetical protein TRFO_10292 [Tritrichomonas foetus]